MLKKSALLLATTLIGCAAFEPDNVDGFENAFQDDFFSGLTNASVNEEFISDEPVSDSELYLAQPNAQQDQLNESDGNLYLPVNDVGMEENLDQADMSIQSTGNGEFDYIFSFSILDGESLEARLRDLLEPYGYKLIWKSDYDVFFENDVLYEDALLVNILKNIAVDLQEMGIDIHINVYLKNKVVLVYSVRN